MQNIKDTLSTVFGLMAGIGLGIVGAATGGFAMPEWLVVAGILMSSIGTAVTGVLIGKNPNLSTKSDAQVDNQNAQAKQ